MRSLNLCKLLLPVLAVLVTILFLDGCTKVYKPDEYNPYRDDVANPPVTSGKPAIGNVYPNNGIVNTAVTISGVNFNTNAANNTVTINGTPAPVISVTSTPMPSGIPKIEVTFVVPANATTGRIVLKTGGVELSPLFDFKVKTATVSTYADLGTNYVEHIAFDGDANLFGDNVTKILKITPTGEISTFAGGETAGTFGFIWGIACVNFDDIYVPDASKYGIYKITKAGIVSRIVGIDKSVVLDGQPNVAGVGSPRSIARDLAGNLYFTDVHRVRKISTTGIVTTIAGNQAEGNVDGKGTAAQFGNLDGITVDTAGRIFVSDRRYLNIRKIERDGTVTTLAGSGAQGFDDGQGNIATFSDPRGIAVDNEGNVYVSDQNKNTSTYAIRVVNRVGRVATLIKGTSNTGVINGPAAQASVNSPNGLTFDPEGNLYIVNTGANIISKVTIR